MPGSIISCPHCGKRNRVGAAPQGVVRCANCHHLLPWIVEATAETFDAETTASVPVLVDLWAHWCMPCKQITPVLERLAQDNAGQLKLVKLDVDRAPRLAAQYGVQGIPTLLLIKDRTEADRLVGAAPQQQIETWLAPHLETAQSG
jgi:thioredoxin 2